MFRLRLMSAAAELIDDGTAVSLLRPQPLNFSIRSSSVPGRAATIGGQWANAPLRPFGLVIAFDPRKTSPTESLKRHRKRMLKNGWLPRMVFGHSSPCAQRLFCLFRLVRLSQPNFLAMFITRPAIWHDFDRRSLVQLGWKLGISAKAVVSATCIRSRSRPAKSHASTVLCNFARL